MFRFVGNRLAKGIAIIAAACLAAFGLLRFAGDPAAGADATGPASGALPIQFARYVGGLFRGEFGTSAATGEAVGAMMMERLPASLELVLAATLIALAAGVVAGLRAALKPHRRGSRVLLAAAFLCAPLPVFVVGAVLVRIFGTGSSGLAALILPALTLAIVPAARMMQAARDRMAVVLDSDPVRVAALRGLPREALDRSAVRGARGPLLPDVGRIFSTVVAMAVVVEAVFVRPGLGLLFVDAVRATDAPVIAAFVVLVPALHVLIAFFSDVSRAIVEPRRRIPDAAVMEA